jgi:hypothetical protein
MAVMSAFALRAALPPRHTPAASAWRTPPRVYSPLTPRRLTRPMAVPATQGVSTTASGSSRRGFALSFLHKR